MEQIQTKYRPPLEVMTYMPPPLHENANALKYIGFQPIPDKKKYKSNLRLTIMTSRHITAHVNFLNFGT